MQRRAFIVGIIATTLATPAVAKSKRRRGRDDRSEKQTPRLGSNQRFQMERTANGWRTAAVLALGTILVFDSGEECQVVEVWDGYSWCEPL